MALKRLTAEEMIQLSTPWITPNDPARSQLEKIPLLAGLLPRLESVHRAVLEIRAGDEDPKVKKLSTLETDLDATHDGLVRGIYGALSMLAELSPAAEELLRLRDQLFPEGLAHTQKTYRGEAGHAAIVAAHMDDGLRARLKAVVLHDKNLSDLVDAWLACAQRLGQLEEERARLGAPIGATAAQVNSARLQWVRVANALVANAELAGLDPDTDRLVFAPLRAAERTANGRKRSRDPLPEPQPTAPTPAAT